MATLDDKLLGEKLHYYCSSSEDEDEAPTVSAAEPPPMTQWDGSSTNTGPKGVIKDWQRYKQLETEKREEQDREKVELAKKLSMTCRTANEDEEAKAREQKIEEELEALLDDDFLQDFMEKRMREMVARTQTRKQYGRLIDLIDGEEFLRAVDEEDKEVVVVMFIFDRSVRTCDLMYRHLQTIAKDYPFVKFCRIQACAAGLSRHFKVSGVPALIVYKGGELVSSFVRITDAIGEDFFASDIEGYLIEHGILTDKTLVPSIIKGPANDDGSDSD